MNKFEFNILENKFLEVSDGVWWLKRIDAIYISRSELEKHKFAIRIQQSNEIVELYFRTNDEMQISNAFMHLAEAIKEVQPSFERVGFSALINYNNVRNIEFSNGVLNSKIIVKFENSKLVKKSGKSIYNEMLQTLQNKKENNGLEQ